MNPLFGIRREDKNLWERRTTLIPEHVKELKDNHGLNCLVQPSPIRVFSNQEYAAVGAGIEEDLSDCSVVFAIKEIPLEFFQKDKTYAFFSHTIKGQFSNMPMLNKMLNLGCTLIEYEKVTDDQGRRLIFFGRYAGLAGMIDTLWALGRRLKWEKIDSPFAHVKQTHQYESLAKAKEAINGVSQIIKNNGLPEVLTPFVCGFAGYGHVSQGAQEIYDLLPVNKVTPSQLGDLIESGADSGQTIYKVVFKEEDIATPITEGVAFELQDYYEHPEKYRSQFERYLQHLNLLVNAIYWDQRYPRLVTKKYLRELFSGSGNQRLRMIGDITCDVEGAVECTVRTTNSGSPVFVYDPLSDRASDGIEGMGIVVLAVDNLPCELPRESSVYFSTVLKEFVPDILNVDYSKDFGQYQLPPAIKRAVIAYRGKLTPNFQYIEKYL